MIMMNDNDDDDDNDDVVVTSVDRLTSSYRPVPVSSMFVFLPGLCR